MICYVIMIYVKFRAVVGTTQSLTDNASLNSFSFRSHVTNRYKYLNKLKCSVKGTNYEVRNVSSASAYLAKKPKCTANITCYEMVPQRYMQCSAGRVVPGEYFTSTARWDWRNIRRDAIGSFLRTLFCQSVDQEMVAPVAYTTEKASH